MEEEFLPYLKEWEESVCAREGSFKKSHRQRMMLSSETRCGLQITGVTYIV